MRQPAKKKKWNIRPLKWIAGIALVLCTALATNWALNHITGLPGVAIKVVSIKGTITHTSPQMLQAVGAQAGRGNFFTVDMKSVQTEFEKVTWVRSASVRRIWPDRLEVTLEEHVPFARWGTDALLNTQSEVFHAQYGDELPHFSGPAGSEREVTEAYHDFRDILQEAELQLKDLTLSPRRAWQVKLKNGMVLELGRVEMRERLTRFVAVNKVEPELRTHRGRADLRYSNGFALKLMGSAMPKEMDKVKKIK
ncbi:MAG: cell division protein FtsQ/DivIB [Pseudomonadota bacterium]